MSEYESTGWDWWEFYLDWMFVTMSIFGAVLIAAYAGNPWIGRPDGIPIPGFAPMAIGAVVAGIYRWRKR